MSGTAETRHPHPFSSANLVRNGGAALAGPEGLSHWEDLSTATQMWARVPVDGFTGDGLPHAAHAFALRTGGGAQAHLCQTIAPGAEAAAASAFVVRVTARRSTGAADCEVIVSTGPAAEDGFELLRTSLTPGADWQRHRFTFDVPPDRKGQPLHLGIRTCGEAPDELWVTDIRLAALYDARPLFSARFNTRGDFLLPSSRLRAFMIEDYLNLLGWQTALNAGAGHELLVCQKVRPWAALIAARGRGQRVVYDLDDNEPVQSPLKAISIRAFSHAVDGVSAGGDVLFEALSRWNANCFLLDNPVDVLEPDLARPDEGFAGRLVWFGMPENQWQLDALSLGSPVTRITRDGDVEYGVKSLDYHLTRHDLALLPVELNAHTKAKNANRMVKCAALGLPFLASDTPEHRRALAQLELPEDFLVAGGEDWNARIAAIGQDYERVLAQITRARARAFEVYGIEQITAGWARYCAGLLGRGQR